MTWDALRTAVQSGEKFTLSTPESVDLHMWNEATWYLENYTASWTLNASQTLAFRAQPSIHRHASLPGARSTELRDAIGDEWSTRDGTIPNRIRKYLYKKREMRMSDDGYTSLCERIAWFKIGGDFTFDFTNKITWKGGDFGDAGSCFMSSETRRAWLMQNDYIGMRFYNGGNGKGCARAWVKPFPEYLVVFNAYGYNLETISGVLAGWTGSDYISRKAWETYGDLYINESSHIVAPKDWHSSHMTNKVYLGHLDSNKDEEQ